MAAPQIRIMSVQRPQGLSVVLKKPAQAVAAILGTATHLTTAAAVGAHGTTNAAAPLLLVPITAAAAVAVDMTATAAALRSAARQRLAWIADGVPHLHLLLLGTVAEATILPAAMVVENVVVNEIASSISYVI